MGGQSLCRHDRALAKTQRQGDGELQSRQPRPRSCSRTLRAARQASSSPIRLDGHGAGWGIGGTQEDPAALDDWSRCGIEKREDIRDLFVPNFYFGCEADDPINAMAFDTRKLPFGARLNAIFSSDIGHWDVPDMTEVTEEAHEMVEHGLIGGR